MQDLNLFFEDGAEPEPHELQTALFLRKLGKEVKFLAPANQAGIKTPDILMDDLKWEIKSPVSNASRTIEHAFRSALKQSDNVIFDLRRSKASDAANLSRLTYVYRLIRGKKVKNLLVITKDDDGHLIDINDII